MLCCVTCTGVKMAEDAEGQLDLPPVTDGTVTYNWKNITQEFFEASRELKLGELMHDSVYVIINRQEKNLV